MLAEFLKDYLPIIVFLLVALVLSVAFVAVNYLASPKNPDPEKLSAYECGFEPFQDSRMEFDVRFYLVAILFMIFDLEFDMDSLRIRDLADDSEYQEFDKRKSTIYNSIKQNTTVTPENTDNSVEAKPITPPDPTKGDSIGRIQPKTDSTKLREFLTNLDDES